MASWKRLSHGRLATFVAIAVLFTAGGAAAYESDHDTVLLVWNAGDFDCESLPMTLVDDHVWECAAPVAASTTYYFQFWPGGGQDPKYGADVLHPGLLVLDDDPSQVPVALDPGYFHFRLIETTLVYEVAPAGGVIELAVTFADDPPSPPADATVAVLDQDTGADLGVRPLGPGGETLIPALIPGRTYELAVAATGYETELLAVSVPDGTPVDVEVTLERLVANVARTWTELKTLFR